MGRHRAFREVQGNDRVSDRPAIPAPVVLLAAGSALEIVAGSLLAMGIAMPFAAAALVVFTLAANMLLLRFWACEGLERQTSRSAFLVNFAVIGGSLLAATV